MVQFGGYGVFVIDVIIVDVVQIVGYQYCIGYCIDDIGCYLVSCVDVIGLDVYCVVDGDQFEEDEDEGFFQFGIVVGV